MGEKRHPLSEHAYWVFSIVDELLRLAAVQEGAMMLPEHVRFIPLKVQFRHIKISALGGAVINAASVVLGRRMLRS